MREKDELLEKLRSTQIPSQLNKEDVRKAMQNIITMEVEQRTKAWVSQQPTPAPPRRSSSSHQNTQLTILENQNNQLKTRLTQLEGEKQEIEGKK